MGEQVFKYNGTSITFQSASANVMINATEMAKPFGKRPSKWLELPTTRSFLEELRAIRKSDRLIATRNGIGTWMNEDVAIEFARWLSPSFAIWCNDRIKEIAKHGFTATPQKLEEIINNPDLIISLATELKKERIEKKALQESIQAQKPKVLFADAVTASHTSILVGELAKIIKQNGVDIGQNRLFKWLRDKGYLISRKGTDYNMPTQLSMNLGLFEIKETTISHADGHISISKTPKVTGKGQMYITNKFINNQIAV